MESETLGERENGDVMGMIAGSGMILVQVAAVIPGLLPVLLLVLAAAVPLLVLAIGAGVLVGVPLGLWRLAGSVVRLLRTHGASLGSTTEGAPSSRTPA